MPSFSNVYFYLNVVFSGVIRVFKTFIKYFSVLFSGMVGFALLALIYTQPTALASAHIVYDDMPTATYNSASLTLALPNGGTTAGHAGTQIQLTGSGFPANSQVMLYAATDPGQCVNGQGGVATIQPSSGSSTTDGNGSFQITAAWPSSGAIQPNTPYYVCANVNGTGVASNTTFTVLPAATATASPATANAGDAVTISGQYWDAQEALTVSITAGQGSPAVISQEVTADGNGNFNVSLTIPTTAQGGYYGISVTDANNPNQTQYFSNALSINQMPTPTAQATATPVPTPTPEVTATATPTSTGNTNNSGSSNNGSMLWLAIVLGVVGVVLVIVGLTMFLTNSHHN
jgi:hypothetical protein